MQQQDHPAMDHASTREADRGASGAWAGAVAAVFGLGSLSFHAPALAGAALLPTLVEIMAGELAKQALESGLDPRGPSVADPFAVVRGAMVEVGPPTLAALGLAVLFAVLVLFGAIGLTFGRRSGRRLLRAALALEGLRALGWGLLVSTSLGAAARAQAAAFDDVLAPLTMRGAGVEHQPAVADFVASITSPAATWGPVLVQVAIVVGLFVWSGSRPARRRTGELPAGGEAGRE